MKEPIMEKYLLDYDLEVSDKGLIEEGNFFKCTTCECNCYVYIGSKDKHGYSLSVYENMANNESEIYCLRTSQLTLKRLSIEELLEI